MLFCRMIWCLMFLKELFCREGWKEGGGGTRRKGGKGIRTEIIFLKTLTRPLYEYHIFFTDREITYARETTLLI